MDNNTINNVATETIDTVVSNDFVNGSITDPAQVQVSYVLPEKKSTVVPVIKTVVKNGLIRGAELGLTLAVANYCEKKITKAVTSMLSRKAKKDADLAARTAAAKAKYDELANQGVVAEENYTEV